MPGGGLDQLRGDAHTAARASNGAFQNVGSVELLTDLLRGDRLVAEGEHLRTGENLELRDLRNFGDDVFGNSVAEVFVFFRATLVLEIKDRDRSLLGGGSRVRTGTAPTLFGAELAAGFDVAAQALQIRAKFRGGLAAQIGVFFERLAQNVFKGERQSGVQFFGGYWNAVQNAVENQRRVPANALFLVSSRLPTRHYALSGLQWGQCASMTSGGARGWKAECFGEQFVGVAAVLMIVGDGGDHDFVGGALPCQG